MKSVKNIQTIGPTASGNTRVKVNFFDSTSIHFYMKADGTLHTPEKHKENQLTNPINGQNEWEWVKKGWGKKLPILILQKEQRSQALELARQIVGPSKVQQEVKNTKKGEVVLTEKEAKKKIIGQTEKKSFFDRYTNFSALKTLVKKQA